MRPGRKLAVTRRYSRRSFLLTFAASLASAGVYGCQTGPVSNTEAVSGSRPAWLIDIIGDQAAAARLGSAYLETHPEEKSIATLLRQLEKAVARDSAATTGSIVALQHRVRTDYARNTVVSVNGWVLSITEARLYGLVAMLAGN